jgi:probable F420-dependent oxidoreductase
MQVGISTPVVIQVPGVASEWERRATIEDLARIAQTADELGFSYLTCSEHVAIPTAAAASRGAVYWDPLATLGFLAARTRNIGLATSVLVLGYHHPLQIAKQYGTLDRVSGGRLILGVGIGSLVEEFDLLGAVWDRRAARADDAIAAIRASMSTRNPEYRGEFYRFGDVVVDPCAEQDRVPIWVGGRTPQSLRRALRLADGWMPFGLSRSDIADMLARQPIPDGFDVVLPTARPVDPETDATAVRRHLGQLRDCGATRITCSVLANSADHYLAQLGRLREIAADVDKEETP